MIRSKWEYFPVRAALGMATVSDCSLIGFRVEKHSYVQLKLGSRICDGVDRSSPLEEWQAGSPGDNGVS